jgi:hypothetical protein
LALDLAGSARGERVARGLEAGRFAGPLLEQGHQVLRAIVGIPMQRDREIFERHAQ